MDYLSLISLGLMVFALAECVQSSDDERVGLHKGIWIVLIVVFPIVGSIAWFVVSRSRRNASRSGQGPTIPPSPVAPDDDPEFLWRLESERRRAAQRSTPPPPGADGQASAPDVAQPHEPGIEPGGPGDQDQGDGAS
jgi:hypothetical protein